MSLSYRVVSAASSGDMVATTIQAVRDNWEPFIVVAALGIGIPLAFYILKRMGDAMTTRRLAREHYLEVAAAFGPENVYVAGKNAYGDAPPE